MYLILNIEYIFPLHMHVSMSLILRLPGCLFIWEVTRVCWAEEWRRCCSFGHFEPGVYAEETLFPRGHVQPVSSMVDTAVDNCTWRWEPRCRLFPGGRDSDAIVMLVWRCSNAIVMLQQCYSDAIVMLLWRCSDALVMLQQCYSDAIVTL